jgi:hypothetical protein
MMAVLATILIPTGGMAVLVVARVLGGRRAGLLGHKGGAAAEEGEAEQAHG